jgi:NAD(P)-dependent dehydrogenase (short-subunit alcohol dehydrogenase family)
LASGDDVAFCSRDASGVAEAERELRAKFSSSSSSSSPPSSKIFSAPCDVSKPGDARRFAAQAAEALGGMDVW